MSKKTEQIYKAIEALEDLKNQISIINQIERAKNAADDKFTAEESHHLENIEFEMGQQIKSLRFWISSLYSFNGKSTSNAKKAASKENGKKGGRPPKEITELRKRSLELDALLDDLRKEKIVTTDYEKEEKLSAEISEYENERTIIEEKLAKWNEERKLI
ncbi:hypothetical protein [uncultured Treponema sp.]|uniref:hypothetical protein n=1 Tax=uncultured Treponema sp. TaxID=162155 RepID=UPI0025DD6E30|nr:hypothetical protein [uncultured Treponema sp.]